MTGTTESPPRDRLQWIVFAALSLGAAGATGILSLSGDAWFERYFGRLEPLLVIALAAALGAASLGFLRSRGGFDIYARGRSLEGAGVAAALATLFAIAVILLDVRVPFPRDLNVPPPQSLLFYPAIGYVAEICFHALPLAVLLGVLGGLTRRHPGALVWPSILLAALLEPVLQVGFGLSARPFSWPDAYVAVHVFAFNLLQMYAFRRYDFVAMYSMRLVYYVCWHIIWGYARLQLLF